MVRTILKLFTHNFLVSMANMERMIEHWQWDRYDVLFLNKRRYVYFPIL